MAEERERLKRELDENEKKRQKREEEVTMRKLKNRKYNNYV